MELNSDLEMVATVIHYIHGRVLLTNGVEIGEVSKIRGNEENEVIKE